MNRYDFNASDLIEDIFDIIGVKKENVFDSDISFALRAVTTDNEKEYEVMVEAPGATQDMVDVQFKDDIVTVKVDYGKDGKLRTGKYAWAKKFKDVNGEGITGTLNGGMLTITLPKKPESQPQKIKIN